jgi:hypothetical protein
MAQQVVESMESRSLGTSGGTLRGKRAFFVWDNTTAITQPVDIQFGSNGLPKVGDLFPGEVDVYAVEFEIEPVNDSSGAWRVAFDYAQGSTGGTPPPTVLPSEPGYLQVSMEYGAVFKDFYRESPGMSLFAGDPGVADIFGTPIDASGDPLSVLVRQHRLVIDETVSIETVESSTAKTRLAVGTRNATTFFGASRGTLLYEGASARRTSLTSASITHRFLYDEYYHMVQQPRRNSQREVEVDATRTFPTAIFVRWVQPFKRYTNFNTLSENF